MKILVLISFLILSMSFCFGDDFTTSKDGKFLYRHLIRDNEFKITKYSINGETVKLEKELDLSQYVTSMTNPKPYEFMDDNHVVINFSQYKNDASGTRLSTVVAVDLKTMDVSGKLEIINLWGGEFSYQNHYQPHGLVVSKYFNNSGIDSATSFNINNLILSAVTTYRYKDLKVLSEQKFNFESSEYVNDQGEKKKRFIGSLLLDSLTPVNELESLFGWSKPANRLYSAEAVITNDHISFSKLTDLETSHVILLPANDTIATSNSVVSFKLMGSPNFLVTHNWLPGGEIWKTEGKIVDLLSRNTVNFNSQRLNISSSESCHFSTMFLQDSSSEMAFKCDFFNNEGIASLGLSLFDAKKGTYRFVSAPRYENRLIVNNETVSILSYDYEKELTELKVYNNNQHVKTVTLNGLLEATGKSCLLIRNDSELIYYSRKNGREIKKSKVPFGAYISVQSLNGTKDIFLDYDDKGELIHELIDCN